MRINQKIIKKHQITYNLLEIVTYVICLPFVIMQILSEVFDKICSYAAHIRYNVVNFIFYLIYKKEMDVENEQ